MENSQIEQMQSHEAVPAAEVFLPLEELSQEIRTAIDNGTITLVEHTNPNTYADVGTYTDVYHDDLVDEAVPSRYTSGNFEDFIFKDGKTVLARASADVENRLMHTARYDNGWYLNSGRLLQEMKTGSVLEQFDITNGAESALKLVNFSDIPLSEKHLEQVRLVVANVASLSGGNIFNQAHAICIFNPERFPDKTMGSTSGISGVVDINAILLTGEKDGGMPEFEQRGIDMFETTLTHELGHLLQLESEDKHNFNEAVGWEDVENRFVDDYGNSISSYRQKLTKPNTVIAEQDGAATTVRAVDQYGKEVVDGAKPVSIYAYTNGNEDFAEGIAMYANTDRDDTASMDSIRRDATTAILQRGAKEYGPFNVSIVRRDTSDRIGGVIKPRVYTMNAPKFKYDPPINPQPTNEHMVSPAPRVEDEYGGQMKRVVDDYGNEMSVFGGNAPKSGFYMKDGQYPFK